MAHNKSLFREWCEITKHIVVKGKGTIVFPTCHGIKVITDVLYMLGIDQNFLSVGQLIEKEYKVQFNNDYCLIKDANGNDFDTIPHRFHTRVWSGT